MYSNKGLREPLHAIEMSTYFPTLLCSKMSLIYVYHPNSEKPQKQTMTIIAISNF